VARPAILGKDFNHEKERKQAAAKMEKTVSIEVVVGNLAGRS